MIYFSMQCNSNLHVSTKVYYNKRHMFQTCKYDEFGMFCIFVFISCGFSFIQTYFLSLLNLFVYIIRVMEKSHKDIHMTHHRNSIAYPMHHGHGKYGESSTMHHRVVMEGTKLVLQAISMFKLHLLLASNMILNQII